MRLSKLIRLGRRRAVPDDPAWQAGIGKAAQLSLTAVADVPERGLVATGIVRNGSIFLGDTLVSRAGCRFEILQIEQLQSTVPDALLLSYGESRPGDVVAVSLKGADRTNLSAVDVLVKIC